MKEKLLFTIYEKNYIELDTLLSQVDDQKIDICQLLLMASQFETYGEIVLVLLNHKADPNCIDAEGESPLFNASFAGCYNCVNYLIEMGARINHQTNYGKTPLMCAFQGAYMNIVDILIHNGADLNLVDSSGNNVFHWLSMNSDRDTENHQEIFAIIKLYSSKSLILYKNKHGFTSIETARQLGRFEIANELEQYV